MRTKVVTYPIRFSRLSGKKLPTGTYAGIDEVAVSCIAGPMVAAVVVLPSNHQIARLPVDSKVLNATEVREMAKQIHQEALLVVVGAIDPQTIDAMGIKQALHCLWGRLADRVKRMAPGCKVVLDGQSQIMGKPWNYAIPIPKADATHDCVSAAAIVAKDWFDRHMTEIGRVLPKYGFQKNHGYPTPAHLEAIRQHGITDVHRHQRTLQALNAEPKEVEVADLPDEEIETMLKQAHALLGKDADLVNQWEKRYLQMKYRDFFAERENLSPRSRFLVRQCYTNLIKAARRKNLLQGEGLPPEVPFQPETLLLDWRHPLRIRTEDLGKLGKVIQFGVQTFLKGAKNAETGEPRYRWFCEVSAGALCGLLSRIQQAQIDDQEAKIPFTYLQGLQFTYTLGLWADAMRAAGRTDDYKFGFRTFRLLWLGIGFRNMSETLEELLKIYEDQERNGRLPPLARVSMGQPTAIPEQNVS